MTEISVIVPVYKVEQYLRKCVDSILAQTFTDFELWLVDDGSPDRCGEICDGYAERDSRIHVIHKDNGGLSSARNAALDQMHGKYVFFIDSDDWITEDALEIMYSTAIRTGAEVVTGNIVVAYEDGTFAEDEQSVHEEIILTGDELLKTLLRPNACNRLYAASLFKDLRYPVGRLYEDVFVYHKILSQIDRMALTGTVSYYYLQRKNSIMNTDYNIRFTDIVDAVYDRALWLDSIRQHKLANETKLFVYSQTAVAFAHLDSSNTEYKNRLDQIMNVYRKCYRELMKDNDISFKQKIRMTVLFVSPTLHSLLWGKHMPINLGG